jgi:hypothetical protein
MTAKEKAHELIVKALVEFEKLTISEAKKIALIAVEFSREFITGDLSESFDKFLYIQDIKQEIEKL